MIPKLDHYIPVVGKKVIENLRASSEHLEGKHVAHMNSTSAGGGVAEILNTLVFLMNDLGMDVDWRTMLGSHSFFTVTKGMHNSLQGNKKWDLTQDRKKIYLEYCKRNSMINHFKDHDIVVFHDPQPLGMIQHYNQKIAWIWRCHIDLSNPVPKTLNFLKPFIKKCDGIVFSSEKFKLKKINVPQYIIAPSIDPLSVKNKQLKTSEARRMLSKHGIDFDKPVLSQVSRFDPWKGYLNLLKIYEKIKEKKDCQLVLMGDMASDDPEGLVIYNKIFNKTKSMKDVHIITEKNDLLVNALQQESQIVFQNSTREGFALTVSEAMWKKTPVLGTGVGGIPLQIKDGKTGFIMKSTSDAVKKALKLLNDAKLREELGRNGHNHIKENFLITRHLQDYVNLFNKHYPHRSVMRGLLP